MARDRYANTDSVQADAVLVARVGSGDSAACRVLMDAHLAHIHGFAWRMLGDQAEAEDVAQETFLRLWRRAGKWRAEARVGTWLHRVAHNLCVDRLRKRRGDTGEEPPDLPDPAPGPAGEYQRAQVARGVEAALDRLPERQRAAIALVHYHRSLAEFGQRTKQLALEFRKVLNKEVHVRCVVAVPGWEIESQASENHLIVNERNLAMLRGWKDQNDYLMNEEVEKLQELLTERCTRA